MKEIKTINKNINVQLTVVTEILYCNPIFPHACRHGKK